MECFYHQGVPAAASCKLCGKGLCRECAQRNPQGLCDSCAIEVLQDEKAQKKLKRANALIDTTGEMIGAIIVGLIAFFIARVVFTEINNGQEPEFFSCLLFFFVPFGWRMFTYLEQWMPTFFLSGPAFMFYLMVKLVASIFLGMICFAYQVLMFIIGIVKGIKAK